MEVCWVEVDTSRKTQFRFLIHNWKGLLGDGAVDDILSNQQVHAESGNGGPPNNGIDGDIVTEGKRNDAGLPISSGVWGEVTDDGCEFTKDVHAMLGGVANSTSQPDGVKWLGAVGGVLVRVNNAGVLTH